MPVTEQDPQVRSDQKKGWSSQCRGGNFATCETIGARCTNPRHANGQESRLADVNPIRRTTLPAAPPPSSTKGKGRVTAKPTIAVEWKDPPAPRRGHTPLPVLLEEAGVMQQLRDQPGRWAQVATYTSLSSAGSAAKNTAKKTGSAFEWVGRSDGAGSALYGRFVGDE